jgi:hypothetical protein
MAGCETRDMVQPGVEWGREGTVGRITIALDVVPSIAGLSRKFRYENPVRPSC